MTGHLLSDQANAMLPLFFASVLLLAVSIDAWRERGRPLWLGLGVRAATFAALTTLLLLAFGSAVDPQFHSLRPGAQIWGKFVQIGWWMLGARVAVGIVRLVVVLENRPRETQIVSDLFAGAIYVATALAVINYVFAVPIGGLVATSGVVAIVLGLALQSTLSDVFSGIAVGLEHAYKPGDLIWVEGGVEGQVLQVSWRSTQIATPHDSIAIVPNSIMAKSRLENRSAPTPMRGITVAISIDANVEPRRCVVVLDAATLACMLPLPQPRPTINCIGLQGDGTAYEIRFAVGASSQISASRTEMLSMVHRHLRHAGIALAIAGVASPPVLAVPSVFDLLAGSDVFGGLPPDQRSLLAERFLPTVLRRGDTLLRIGEMPEALHLISAGTVELADEPAGQARVVLRSSPGDSVGMIALIMGGPSLVTATALTALHTFRLEKPAMAAVLRACPELAMNLEALAKRGLAWLQCENAPHVGPQMEHPEMLIGRVRQFLHRLAV